MKDKNTNPELILANCLAILMNAGWSFLFDCQTVNLKLGG